MDWQTFLISQKVWRDDEGNTLCFSDCDLNGKKSEGIFWIYLDEGLRCGGMHRPIPVSLAAVKDALLGCRKEALWLMVQNDLEGAGIDVRREIDRGTDT